MINIIEYGSEVFIDNTEYCSDDRIYLDSIKISEDNKYKFDIRESSSGLYIKPFNFVGTIQLSKTRINIYPRFNHSFSKLIQMILFTKGIKYEYLKRDLDTNNSSMDLIEVVITLFLEEVKLILKNNLSKGYIDKTDNLNVMRGSINFTKHITNNYLRGESIYCDYDELSYDILENSIILRALKIALNKTTDYEKRREIRKYISILDGYCSEYKQSKFPKIQYNRLNSHYKEVHYYCELLIDVIGIDNIYEDGNFKGKYSILIDMNELFELFVVRLCEKYISNKYSILPQKIITNAITDKSGLCYRRIIPDILLIDKETKEYVIIDTKNKDYGNKKVSNEDIYQLSYYGMYFSNLFENNIRIVIVYPSYEENSMMKKDIFMRGIKNINSDIKINLIGIDINECLQYIYDH